LAYISAAESICVSSTTSTYVHQKFPNSVKLRTGRGYYAVQGHRVLYQSKARMRLPIND